MTISIYHPQHIVTINIQKSWKHEKSINNVHESDGCAKTNYILCNGLFEYDHVEKFVVTSFNSKLTSILDRWTSGWRMQLVT